MIHLTKPTPCLICNKFMPKGAQVEMITINKYKRYFHVSCFNSLPKQGGNNAIFKLDSEQIPNMVIT